MKSLIELKKPDGTLAQFLPEQEPRLGVRYVPSQFVIPFEHRGRPCLYHSLTTQMLEASLPEPGEWNEENEALIRGQFLVPEDKDECAYYNQVSALMRTLEEKPGDRGYVILPTLRCNARCVYCYEAGQEQSTMSPETVEATLRYILENHGEEPVWITWFGGEPLLCQNIMDRICGGLREAGVRYRGKIISNGALITPAVIEKMTDLWNVAEIQVSMDGAEPDYIARKNYYVYRKDYRGVMESISRMSEAGISVVIRCNVDESNWPGIPQFVRDLGQGVAHKEKVRLYYAPLHQLRSSEQAMPMWRKIQVARNLAADVGFRPSSSYSVGLRFRTHSCMVGAGTAVICPDGRISACEHCPSESFFGTVFEGVTDPARKAEFCREDRTREMCRDCPYLPICTSFASCPTPSYDCRAMHRLFLLEELHAFVEGKASRPTEDGAPEREPEADTAKC